MLEVDDALYSKCGRLDDATAKSDSNCTTKSKALRSVYYTRIYHTFFIFLAVLDGFLLL